MEVGDRVKLDGIDMVVLLKNSASDFVKYSAIFAKLITKAFGKRKKFANSKHKQRQVRMRGK